MGTVADAWRAPAVTGPVGSGAPATPPGGSPSPAASPGKPAAPAPAPVPVPSVPPTPRPVSTGEVVRDPEAAAAAAAAALLATRPEVLAARAAVRASRSDMEEELVRLEAAARAAVDVKAKIKRNPVRVAGAAAGIGFLAVGGPGKVVRRARYAVFGKPDPLPEAMLPDEIEKALKSLGPDGAKVRGALERDFADYVARTEKRKDRRSTVLFLLLPTIRILILRFGKQFIEEVLSTRGGFEEQMARVRARYADDRADPPPGL